MLYLFCCKPPACKVNCGAFISALSNLAQSCYPESSPGCLFAARDLIWSMLYLVGLANWLGLSWNLFSTARKLILKPWVCSCKIHPRSSTGLDFVWVPSLLMEVHTSISSRLKVIQAPGAASFVKMLWLMDQKPTWQG